MENDWGIERVKHKIVSVGGGAQPIYQIRGHALDTCSKCIQRCTQTCNSDSMATDSSNPNNEQGRRKPPLLDRRRADTKRRVCRFALDACSVLLLLKLSVPRLCLLAAASGAALGHPHAVGGRVGATDLAHKRAGLDGLPPRPWRRSLYLAKPNGRPMHRELKQPDGGEVEGNRDGHNPTLAGCQGHQYLDIHTPQYIFALLDTHSEQTTPIPKTCFAPRP